MSIRSWRRFTTVVILLRERSNAVKGTVTYVGFLILFLLLFLSTASSGEPRSDYFGFHTQVIKANSFTPLSLNVTRHRGGIHTQNINESFGLTNEIGLKSSDFGKDADIIWVQDGDDWLQIFYSEDSPPFFTQGWRAIGYGNIDMGPYPIPLNSGLFIQSKKEDDWLIGFSGYVRQDAMFYNVRTGFNILNRGYPLPIPLNQSGIEQSFGFKKGDQKTGDLIWARREDGIYDQYYYTEGLEFPPLNEGWKKIGEGDRDVGWEEIPNTLIIETRNHIGGQIILYPPAGLERQKTLTELGDPPRPYIFPRIAIDHDGPYFVVAWLAHNFNVLYTTQVFDGGHWFDIDSQRGIQNEILSNWASILPLGRGIGRIISEWSLEK